MFNKEQLEQARTMIRDSISDMIFNCFDGFKTEEDVKRLITMFQKIATISSINASIFDGLLAGYFAGKNDEAKK